MKSKLLRQTAAAFKGRVSLEEVQQIASRRPPLIIYAKYRPGTLASVSISEGTDYQAAIQKNAYDLRIAIAYSSWPQAAKDAAFWNLPAGLLGGGGSASWDRKTH
jgi:hypothetical protein